jgi:hypothetical protein
VNGTGVGNFRAVKRPPRDQFVFYIVNNFGIPLDGFSTQPFDDPVGALRRQEANGLDVLHDLRDVGEIAPKTVYFGARAVDGDGFVDAYAGFRRNGGSLPFGATLGADAQGLIRVTKARDASAQKSDPEQRSAGTDPARFLKT